ncbi:MAG: YgiW/YdeI family stress tolerance OB fold protein [Desulfovibrionaceae bacterium]|nr:YgiW/YdeI family stress tolerance OB fold protein [Desulfovibrionaceae bacterium]
MRFLGILALVLFLASPVWAQGGFQGPGSSANVSTVAQAKAARDETPVVLTGYIISRAGGDHEHYLFRDSSGEIVVDIDDKLFMGRTVTPTTKVRLYGEVDKEMLERVKIEVDQFEILP